MPVLEIQQHQGIPPELQERLQQADPQFVPLMMAAAQRLGRLPKSLLETAQVLNPKDDQ